MNRQQHQCQAERSQSQMHRPQRLYLLQLEARNDGSRSIHRRPGNFTNGRCIESHIEVRPGVELNVLRAPSFHLASSREKIYKKEKNFAGNQQRLK